MNPEVDIGQVEGAFVMGLGYWRCEHIVYDETTGVNLTTSTNVSIAENKNFFIPPAPHHVFHKIRTAQNLTQ